MATAAFNHLPVMVTEVTDILTSVPDGVVVDATVGGGGHAAALLRANDQIDLIGLDQDTDALSAARRSLAEFGDRVQLHHTRFDRLAQAVESSGVTALSGCLFDLGVSSHQLDTAERGFSFRHDGPLDMRMNTSGGRTADDIVNSAPVGELIDLLRNNADERFAKRIAHAIVNARPVHTTAELAEIVRDAIPAPARRSGGHPARRAFQALRIEVNNELDILEDALTQALELLSAGGRLAVLSYHSGEDSIVKRCMRDAAGQKPPARPGLPQHPDDVATVQLLWRGARKPSAEELTANPRAQAARLRAVEALEAA